MATLKKGKKREAVDRMVGMAMTTSGNEANNNIRRSERKSAAEKLQEEKEKVQAQLRASDDKALDLAVENYPGKGRGVVATRDFKSGEFVVEYSGEILEVNEAKERESKYCMDISKGSYMYFFKHKGKEYW